MPKKRSSGAGGCGGGGGTSRPARSPHLRFCSLPTLPLTASVSTVALRTPASLATPHPRTRLEVLTGLEVNFSILSQYFATVISFLLTAYHIFTFSSKWTAFVSAYGSSTAAPVSAVDIISDHLQHTGSAVFKVLSILLALYYAVSLAVAPTRSNEQFWTCILLSIPLVFNNPLLLYSQHFPLDDTSEAHLRHFVLSDCVYTFFIYLYILLMIHSYRLRRNHFSAVRSQKLSKLLAFYLPKVLILLAYLSVYIVTSYTFRISFSIIPTIKLYYLASLCRHYASFRDLNPDLFMPQLLLVFTAIILVDIFFVYFVFYAQIRKTSAYLATVSYTENRNLQLGFRCFVYQLFSLIFCISLLSLFIFYSLPTSYLLRLSSSTAFVIVQPLIGHLSLAFIYFSWNLVLTYVNLPPQPLLTNVFITLTARLNPLRRNRIAVWLGLADLVSTEEAEDTDDEDTAAADPNAVSVNLHENMLVNEYGAVVTPRSYTKNVIDGDEEDASNSANSSGQKSYNAGSNKNLLSKPTPVPIPASKPIPMRYRHRELYDMVPIPHPPKISPTAAATTTREPKLLPQDPSYPPTLHLPPPCVVSSPAAIPLSASASSAASATAIIGKLGLHLSRSVPRSLNKNGISPATNRAEEKDFPRDSDSLMRRRLKVRKNLFVMETQVLMVNIAYLSYVFGNRNEELPSAVKYRQYVQAMQNPITSSGLKEKAEGKEAKEQQQLQPEEDHDEEEDENEPGYDDGSMFRVDPYKMAESYGFTVYKYISCEELNTHVVVLVSPSRVVVGFSGTRDISNWRTNADFNRELLDDHLTRFEYELDQEPQQHVCSAVTPATSFDCDASHDVGTIHEVDEETDTDYADVDDDDDKSVLDAFADNFRRSMSAENVHRRSSSTAYGTSMLPPKLSGPASSFTHGAKAPLLRGAHGKKRKRGQKILTKTEQTARQRPSSGEHVSLLTTALARELRTFGQAKVHRGILEAYESVRKPMLGALVSLYHHGGLDVPLFFCGHSMGGAIAIFAAYEAARYYRRIGLPRRDAVSCSTFGCPRIGNEAFKMRYERLCANHLRFEMAVDPIPKIPNFLNYTNVGTAVLIDQSGMLLIDPSFIEVQWWSKLSNPYLGYKLHIRASYCLALRAYCKQYRSGADDLKKHFWPFPLRFQTKGFFDHLAPPDFQL